jgi:hypothetical protein
MNICIPQTAALASTTNLKQMGASEAPMVLISNTDLKFD